MELSCIFDFLGNRNRSYLHKCATTDAENEYCIFPEGKISIRSRDLGLRLQQIN